ncbi:MAG: DUF6807 family protein [Cyclobacteriaceae bacterium]|nr:DUF6807 family protein [Cyclobacteriaceae bacterium]
MKTHYLFLLLFVLMRCVPVTIEAPQKLKLLILSGRNNHEWQQTTPYLEKMYKSSGRFDVAITEMPDTLSYEALKPFHAVVSNYSLWPDKEFRLPEKAENGLIHFINEGGGLVIVHAASATFYTWPEFQQLAGSNWGDSTHHGKICPHKIVIKEKEHPITKGMADFWITDELWENAGTTRPLNVLAEALVDSTGRDAENKEPALHWYRHGKGRVFHSILGHNVRAMKNSGWTILALRGTEWVATGEVTMAIPQFLASGGPPEANSYSWKETDTTLALMNGLEVVWQYNFNTQEGKPFFHPVNVNGSTLTWLSPEDHPWHLGIWHSWKFINGVNYWEYDQSEGVLPFHYLGITDVRDIRIIKNDDFSSELHLKLFYHEKDGLDLLEENRTIRIAATREDGGFFIEWQMELTALQDSVMLNRTPLPHEENGKDWGGYAGLSVRFSQDLFEPSFINSDGSSGMDHGKSMPWKYYGLRDILGKKVGVAIFTGDTNLNYPEPWFVSKSEDHPFYYVSPAPIFYAPHTLKKGETVTLQYRMQCYSGEVNAAQLRQDYENYLRDINTKKE